IQSKPAISERKLSRSGPMPSYDASSYDPTSFLFELSLVVCKSHCILALGNSMRGFIPLIFLAILWTAISPCAAEPTLDQSFAAADGHVVSAMAEGFAFTGQTA